MQVELGLFGLLVHSGWHGFRREVSEERQRITMLRDGGRPEQTRRLTPREFQVAYLSALGYPGKHVAGELGISWTTVRGSMSRALDKLDLRSCAQLPGLWHGLDRQGSIVKNPDGSELIVFEHSLEVSQAEVRLTGTECQVLTLVITGQSNAEIARARNTSLRTVANQLASLLQKFRAGCRNELAARALGLEPSSLHERWLTP